ncbi:unnamed protein product [Acanthocheilonema viteae]|uniref:Uncharacterized protein n=1 Tax=Acanthocheilonema viteae TaxID=6277 RepID=A0A498SMM5_ACAVI|nr:unnamed protein product [Acanthocheilonema viteae]
MICKEYYDEICTLLYRHNQMEIKQMKEDWELSRKKESHQEPKEHTKLPQQRSNTNSEKIILLKDDLRPFKIDHNVEIKGRTSIAIEKMVNKRRTWIGIEDDGRFEPIQMPTAGVTQEIQARNATDKCVSVKESSGQETAV